MALAQPYRERLGYASPTSKKIVRKAYLSDSDETCGGCQLPIPAGEEFWRGRAREPWHKACRRINIHAAPERQRYIQDVPVGKPCEGCDCEISQDDQVIFIFTMPWHRECALRRRKMPTESREAPM